MKTNVEFINDLHHIMEQNYANPKFDLEDIAAAMAISDRQLQRRVKALTGLSPVQYLRHFRLKKSLQHLRDGIPAGETARITGFSSHTYFTHCFHTRYGITPREIRQI